MLERQESFENGRPGVSDTRMGVSSEERLSQSLSRDQRTGGLAYKVSLSHEPALPAGRVTEAGGKEGHSFCETDEGLGFSS